MTLKDFIHSLKSKINLIEHKNSTAEKNGSVASYWVLEFRNQKLEPPCTAQ